MSPDEKIITRSGRIHYHHSQIYSNRRAHINSIPSPVRKLHKRFGVDELRGEMNKIEPPTFDGEHKKNEDAET
jgi:hypothetical protein